MAEVALEEFRIVVGRMSEERDAATPLHDQVRRDVMAALGVVAADRHPGRTRLHGAPADEMRALLHQPLQPAAGFQIVSITQKDDAVGLLAVLVVGLPVGRQLLERDQQVVAAQCACTGNAAQHGQEERVDRRFVGRGIFEEKQRQRSGMLPAQVGRVLVHLVVELFGDGEDALACFLVDHRTAPQGARHGGLGHAREVGDVQRGGLPLDGRDHGRLRIRTAEVRIMPRRAAGGDPVGASPSAVGATQVAKGRRQRLIMTYLVPPRAGSQLRACPGPFESHRAAARHRRR